MIRVGISACLTGAPVRFDGSGKRDRFLIEELGEHVEWVSVCPEVAAGMGTPRPTVRLVRLARKGASRAPAPERMPVRMIDPKHGTDWTETMQATCDREVERLAALELCGFVLKSRSPSCGMERVRVYEPSGMPSKDGVGMFAAALRERLPQLPIEEDGRLKDPALREAFLDAVFAYARLKTLLTAPSARGLVDFHQRNKYLLRAHDPDGLRQLGRVVAAAGARDPGQVGAEYAGLFMQALARRPTVRKHTAVLSRIAGHLDRWLTRPARAVLDEAIGDYRAGLVPRAVPLTLVRSHARENQLTYLCEQTYLTPYPKNLARAA